MTRWRFFLFLLAGLSFLSACAPDPKAVQRATIHLNLGTSYLQQGDPTTALRDYVTGGHPAGLVVEPGWTGYAPAAAFYAY